MILYCTRTYRFVENKWRKKLKKIWIFQKITPRKNTIFWTQILWTASLLQLLILYCKRTDRFIQNGWRKKIWMFQKTTSTNNCHFLNRDLMGCIVTFAQQSLIITINLIIYSNICRTFPLIFINTIFNIFFTISNDVLTLLL